MNWKMTYELGAIGAELSGEDREEMQGELLEFIEFVEENAELATEEAHFEADSVQSVEGGDDTEQITLTNSPSIASENLFKDIPVRTGLDEDTLSQYFGIDPTGEEPPFLDFNDEVLGEDGSSRSEKQMRGSLILLSLWRESLHEERVTSPGLKNALRMSGIDDTNLYNMYGYNNDEGNQYFSRHGNGENTEIELSLPGKREGYDQIRRTVEHLESGDVDE